MAAPTDTLKDAMDFGEANRAVTKDLIRKGSEEVGAVVSRIRSIAPAPFAPIAIAIAGGAVMPLAMELAWMAGVRSPKPQPLHMLLAGLLAARTGLGGENPIDQVFKDIAALQKAGRAPRDDGAQDSSPPVIDSADAERLLTRVQEVTKEEGGPGGKGFWRTCSGCHESEDGHDVGYYPFSEHFNCTLGSGCSDCGGIGAIWDTTDYDDLVAFRLEEDDRHQRLDDLTNALRRAREWLEGWASASPYIEEIDAVLSSADTEDGVTIPQQYQQHRDALAVFTAYFVKNYPGPDTIIHKPEWHAPQIFRAVRRAIAEAAPKGQSVVVEEIAAERRRQIETEGWTPEHDDGHVHYELSRAAHLYARHAANNHADPHYAIIAAPDAWPWEYAWWKPKTPRRDLIRAAALLIAEIERLDRRIAKSNPGESR